jgi:hypothetical protein
MIVFNLSCAQHHHFDGWFRSSEDYERQSAQSLIECPMCGGKEIAKHLSAPRINVGLNSANARVAPSQVAAGQPDAMATGTHDVIGATTIPSLQSHMLKQFKQFVLTNTENVGSDFAETARKMHYGEESQRNIRGRISMEDSQALREEGIETVGLPPGIFLDEGVQ